MLNLLLEAAERFSVKGFTTIGQRELFFFPSFYLLICIGDINLFFLVFSSRGPKRFDKEGADMVVEKTWDLEFKYALMYMPKGLLETKGSRQGVASFRWILLAQGRVLLL